MVWIIAGIAILVYKYLVCEQQTESKIMELNQACTSYLSVLLFNLHTQNTN